MTAILAIIIRMLILAQSDIVIPSEMVMPLTSFTFGYPNASRSARNHFNVLLSVRVPVSFFDT